MATTSKLYAENRSAMTNDGLILLMVRVHGMRGMRV
jgi:hypothetical protein